MGGEDFAGAKVPVSRRDVVHVGTGVAALAGAAAVIGNTVAAAVQERPIRAGQPHPFYDYSAITKRPRLKWPNGARVAVFIVPNVEHWDVKDDKGHMDVRNEPRNDYGLRVAIWRLFEIFGDRGIRTTIALNAAVCRFYPEIIAAFRQRGDELMGHGLTNSERLDTLSPVAAADLVREAVTIIRSSTGESVRGWLGPGLAETDGTLDAIKAAGLEYVCDWGAADDQPFRMKNGLYAVPYTLDINDIGLIDRQGTPAAEFAAYIIDAFDTLYREGEDQARVLPIALHPFLIGAPHRAPHLAKALDYIKGHDQVWFARGGEILDAYRTATTG